MHTLGRLLFVLLLAIAVPVKGEIKKRIIDGTPVSENQFPYVALLQLDGDLLCTGTLISSRYIMTAAHCFFGENNERSVGNTDIVARLAGQEIQSKTVHIHPSYRSRNSACVEGEVDAAIIELASEPTGITPIPLLDTAPPIGSTVLIAGYGTLGNGEQGQDGSVPPKGTIYYGVTQVEGLGDSPPEQDSNSTYFYWTFDQGESNTASGDSGGPAFLDVNGTRFLAGHTCGGDGNAEIGTLSFDTRADILKSWAESIAGSTPSNTPPGFSGITPLNATVGQAFSYSVVLTGSRPMTLTATNLPAGLVLDGTTIKGTPTPAGSSTVQLVAANAFGEATTDLSITVATFDPHLRVSKALLQFDYRRGAHDFLDLTGKIDVGKGFKPRNKRVVVQIGRFSKTFRLQANGESAGSGISFFDLVGPQRGGGFSRSTVQYFLTFEKVKLFDELATLGFPDSQTASRGQVVAMPLSVTINGFESTITINLKFRSSDARWVLSR